MVEKEQLKVDLQSIPGSGAAGGLGAAFAGFLNTELVPGVELVLKTVKFEEKLNKIDSVITGEGKLDRQSSIGKAPTGVAIIVKKYQVPVIGFSGDISQAEASLHDNGIDTFFSIVSGPTSLEDAMDPSTTRHNLRRLAEQVGRLLRIFQYQKGGGDRWGRFSM